MRIDSTYIQDAITPDLLDRDAHTVESRVVRFAHTEQEHMNNRDNAPLCQGGGFVLYSKFGGGRSLMATDILRLEYYEKGAEVYHYGELLYGNLITEDTDLSFIEPGSAVYIPDGIWVTEDVHKITSQVINNCKLHAGVMHTPAQNREQSNYPQWCHLEMRWADRPQNMLQKPRHKVHKRNPQNVWESSKLLDSFGQIDRKYAWIDERHAKQLLDLSNAGDVTFVLSMRYEFAAQFLYG